MRVVSGSLFQYAGIGRTGRERKEKEATGKHKYQMTDAFGFASGNARKYMKIFNRKEVDNDVIGGTILEETDEVPCSLYNGAL